ncbi:MAG: PQQ-dependent sugar dehydrogenase [Phycisphaerales bacterium]
MCVAKFARGLAAFALVAGLAGVDAAEAGTTIATQTIIPSGLTYPTWIGHAPGDTSRLFVIEKAGRIRIIDLTTNTLLPTAFLNIDPIVTGGSATTDEQGLLGMAFDPDYSTNGQFYVYYTSNSSTDVLARYTVSANPNVADAASGVIMLSWSDPFTNHNGGWMDFGPDGNLYLGVGDGGSGNDPGNRAQTIVNMRLGKMLRIKPTVGGTSPYYTIPTGNPFVGVTGDDEIWSYGLRNPWRCSFDRMTGDLWIADVGQNAVEEVNFEPAGAAGGRNYGWRCTEGTTCTGLTGCTCNGSTLTAPIHTYTHVSGTTGGFCIIGGYVYRGCRMPDLEGVYFFADYNNNNVWSFRYVNGVKSEFTLRNSQITPSLQGTVVNTITTFGEDANGEIYLADNGGQIYKIVPSTGDGVCPQTVFGDLNNDGVVDGTDLGLLLGNWGASGVGDLNADHTVDGTDLGLLLGAWTS